jgi:hypothetical protein
MPAWIGGIQVRTTRPKTSTSASIAAFHAEIEEFIETERGVLHLSYFQRRILVRGLRFRLHLGTTPVL